MKKKNKIFKKIKNKNNFQQCHKLIRLKKKLMLFIIMKVKLVWNNQNQFQVIKHNQILSKLYKMKYSKSKIKNKMINQL